MVYNIPKFLEVQSLCEVTYMHNGSHIMVVRGCGLTSGFAQVSDRLDWRRSELRGDTLYLTYISANGLGTSRISPSL